MTGRLDEALATLRRVLGALLLHDMRTRFGRNYLAYLLAIAWPLAHLVTIVVARALFGKIVPIGDDPATFAATGVMPYILCLYPARMMAPAIAVHKPLLQFPIIKPISIIFVRATLEILNAFVVVALFVIGLRMLDMGLEPFDVFETAAAIVVSIYLGVGIGFFGAVLYPVLGFSANLILILTLLGLYLTSGAFIPTTIFPQQYRELNWYNPLYHCVEWLRSGYFGVDSFDLSRFYVLFVGTFFLFIGLLGERMIRGRLLR